MKAVLEPILGLVAAGVPSIPSVRRLPSYSSRAREKKGSTCSSSSSTRCQYRQGWNPDPQKDTRIHWSSPDEGWIGSGDSQQQGHSRPSTSSVLEDLLTSMAGQVADSHYEFLGVSPDVDVEGIKVAYRRLSKLYHPDTTTLPIEQAAQKFMRLQRAYDVLSSVEERKSYDWDLAQEMSRRQPNGTAGADYVWPSDVVDQTQEGSPFKARVVQEVNSKEGYVEFTGQMLAALFFDAFAVLVCIICMSYVAFFKHD